MSLPHYLIQNGWGPSTENTVIELNNNQNGASKFSGQKTGLNICMPGDNSHLASQGKQMVWQSAWITVRDGLGQKSLSRGGATCATGRTLGTDQEDNPNVSKPSSLVGTLVKRWSWRTRKRFTPGYSLNGAFLECIWVYIWNCFMALGYEDMLVSSVQHPSSVSVLFWDNLQ